MLEMHLIISGRVQGVGFRAPARRLAEQLKLTGYVANLANGSVEICAQGERKDLETFLAKLQAEFSGYVSNIACDWHLPTIIYDSFSINLS